MNRDKWNVRSIALCIQVSIYLSVFLSLYTCANDLILVSPSVPPPSPLSSFFLSHSSLSLSLVSLWLLSPVRSLKRKRLGVARREALIDGVLCTSLDGVAITWCAPSVTQCNIMCTDPCKSHRSKEKGNNLQQLQRYNSFGCNLAVSRNIKTVLLIHLSIAKAVYYYCIVLYLFLVELELFLSASVWIKPCGFCYL